MAKMMESYLQDSYNPAPRPALLTVLCILSFVGSTYSILSAVFSYVSADRLSLTTSTAMYEMRKQESSGVNMDTAQATTDSTPGSTDITPARETNTNPTTGDEEFRMEMFGNLKSLLTPEKIKNNAIGALIAALLTLTGAIFMFRLRRTGFYLYISGVLAGIVIPFMIFGNNLLVAGMSAFSGFLGILFIILYALNLKSMQ